MNKKNNHSRNFIFESFFSGKVIAKGNLIVFFPKKKVKNIFANFKGTFKNNHLKIKEEYFENEKKVLRYWSFKKQSDNTFIGAEKNVKGKIIVYIQDNHLHMKYYFKILVWKFTLTVLIKDYMFLINRKEVVNTTYVSIFGITLAKVVLLYKKQS
tara:strand:- start:161 stop:625 length:465 start_codon:yes stop_codon:yes gene_type:complete